MQLHQTLSSSAILKEPFTPKLISGLAWSAGRIIDKQESLLVTEERAIASAVEKRKNEFRAGRTCAREALRLLGSTDLHIPMRPDRSPDWPTGFVGSISHTSSIAASVVAKRHQFAGLGLDIEENSPLTADLCEIIMRSDERERLPQKIKIGSSFIDMAKVIFSIKEAVYKAVFPLTGVFLSFQDVSVRIDPKNESYSAQLCGAVDCCSDQNIHGSLGHALDHVVATAMIPAGLESLDVRNG